MQSLIIVINNMNLKIMFLITRSKAIHILNLYILLDIYFITYSH